MTVKKIGLYLLFSSFLSVGIYVWYIQFHFAHMPAYPLKLRGLYAIAASALLGFFLVNMAYLLRPAFPLAQTVFYPTLRIVITALTVFLLMPLGNLMWIPIPTGVLFADRGTEWLVALFPLIYAIIALAVAAGRLGVVLLLLMLVAYIGGTLFLGISYF